MTTHVRAILLALFGAVLACSQETAISGRVTDPSGGVIANAQHHHQCPRPVSISGRPCLDLLDALRIAWLSPSERTLTLLVGQTAGAVSPTEVKRLPLNGRNYLQLAMMVPGITSNDVTNSPLGATDSGKLQINVDGQQVTQNAAGDAFGEPQIQPRRHRSISNHHQSLRRHSRTILADAGQRANQGRH